MSKKNLWRVVHHLQHFPGVINCTHPERMDGLFVKIGHIDDSPPTLLQREDIEVLRDYLTSILEEK